MRLLLLNPNTSAAVTERLAASARAAAAADTQIVPLTAPRGVPFIASRAEAQIAGAVVLEMLAEHHGRYDAAIIAAFADPGLLGARELFDVPIVGLAEAAMLTACMLGRRFSIVTFSTAMGPWFRECVDVHGLGGRCASIRMLDEPFASLASVQEEKERELVALANRAVSEDEADVVILAGAPLTGLAARVRHRIPVPLVEQTIAAVRQAETLVALSPIKATRGTFRRPPAKASTGLASSLANRIAHQDD
jgi:Asp/Glu/hydantoin racemase